MDILGVVIELLKFTIPSVIVFLITYFVMKAFFANEEKKRELELRLKNENIITPIRLQAYERLTLLLERISPTNLIMRVNKPGLTASQLKAELIAEIHHEFNHNLSQQVYISPQAWSLVKAVKEEIINLVNISYAGMPEKATGLDLSKHIFELLIKRDEIPTSKALDFLKKEIQIVF